MKVPPLRAATTDDADAIVGLLRMAHQEVPYGKWSEPRVREMVEMCLSSGAVLLSLSHGTPVGTVGISIDRCWWSDDMLLQERWVFVHPAHRRAPHARTLLRAVKQTVMTLGMPMLIGVSSTIRTAGKVRLFQREFGAPIGATFMVEG